MALQLSLIVQLPSSQGGLQGSTCYITTTDVLPTSRLVEIKANHPQLSALSSDEALDRIETVATNSLPKLLYVLEHAIHKVRQKLADTGHPLRLLVIDSLSFVLNYDTKTTAKTLFERSKDVMNIALFLHRLASEHHVAVLVINGVNSVFTSNRSAGQDHTDAVIYLDQARWFGRGDGISVDGPVEAGLGLVWANQVGTRIMLTRTGRRKYVSNPIESKRRLIISNAANDGLSQDTIPSSIESEDVNLEETVLIRQFSVVFSQFAPPSTVDCIITPAGIISLNTHDA